MYILKPSLSLHWVYDNFKAHSFLIWGIFCGSCSSQWKELALVMRKCLPFLIIDANSPH